MRTYERAVAHIIIIGQLKKPARARVHPRCESATLAKKIRARHGRRDEHDARGNGTGWRHVDDARQIMYTQEVQKCSGRSFPTESEPQSSGGARSRKGRKETLVFTANIAPEMGETFYRIR